MGSQLKVYATIMAVLFGIATFIIAAFAGITYGSGFSFILIIAIYGSSIYGFVILYYSIAEIHEMGREQSFLNNKRKHQLKDVKDNGQTTHEMLEAIMLKLEALDERQQALEEKSSNQ